ncbi:MAG TPA: S41 family peptidase [Gemmatimonadales bacterium]|nr:S41 family peptidase [Gemmatimonadales bacterium]
MKHRWGLFGLVAAVSFASGAWLTQPHRAASLEAYRRARVFGQVMDRIADDYVDPVDEAGLYTEAARHAVQQLQDPYSDLLVGKDLQAFNDQLAGASNVTAALPLPAGEGHASAAAHARLLPGGVGYVELRAMTEGSALELRAAVDSLRRQGMRALVLDLRTNPGGLIDQGVAIAELFLDPGDTVAVIQGRTQRHSRTYVADAAQPWPDLPLALLVGPNTASSAELIAGALQDDGRATVVGTRTFGKGVVQTTYSLAPDVAVKLTTARWYTPHGRSVQRPRVDSLARGAGGAAPQGGLAPDVVVQPWRPGPGDRALLGALGGDYGAFRDAVEAEARALAAAQDAGVRDARFVVTPAMRDGLYTRLGDAGFLISRELFDGAATLVDRELGYALARAALGPEGELRRRTADDLELQSAARLLRRAR